MVSVFESNYKGFYCVGLDINNQGKLQEFNCDDLVQCEQALL